MRERYRLYKATENLLAYFDEVGQMDRDKVMELVHLVNEAYIDWADMIDRTEKKG